MIKLIALPLIGFLIGFLIISLGGGGGVFYVGILTVFFNVPPAIAATTSLATIIPTTAMGSFSHWRAGNVNIRFGLTMLAGGAAGAIVGSLCSHLLPQSLYNKLTGVLLLVLSVQMVLSYIKKRRTSENQAEENSGKKLSTTLKAVLFGFLGGAMSGLIGLSGSSPIIVGLTVLGCGALETVGTSVLVLLGISVTGFLIHLGLGNVDWKLVGLLIIGTMTGAFLAPVFLCRISKDKMEKILQPILILMVVVMGIVLLFK